LTLGGIQTAGWDVGIIGYVNLSPVAQLRICWSDLALNADHSNLTTEPAVVITPPDAAGADPASVDLELLRAMAGGDTAALGTFYDRHVSTLFAFAYRMLNDRREAEDVVQEVLLQIWEKSAAFDAAHGRPLAWAIAITRNRAIDRLRSAQRRARILDESSADIRPDDGGFATAPDELAGTGETARLVRAALSELPPEQRRAIEMSFFGGLSQSEIAAELNEALGTVKARIRRGMLRLRDALGARADE
jgi:RNA polymerase sigma-70 factor, ECF subfamily